MAVRFLTEQGYTILERNYRNPYGELDVIAEKGEYLVYVEIKFRSGGQCGDPLEAVDRRKQRQICRVAFYHYVRYGAAGERPCRFDVIGVYGDGSIKHIENAFDFQK